MEVSQVRKALQAIEALGKKDQVLVTLTAGYSFYASESTILDFNDGDELLKVIRINHDSTRNVTKEDNISVVFVDYTDIDMIECTASENVVRDNMSSIGDFDEDKVKALFAITSKQSRFIPSTAPNDYVTRDNDGNITAYSKLDPNGNKILPTDIPNVPRV